MDVYSTELGIRLSFGKTSEYRGGGVWTSKRPFGTPLRRSGGIALLTLDLGARKGWVVSATPRPLYRYPLYRRLGGPQGRSGRVRKISPPPGFDPRTVQPVVSRYTDWATGPTSALFPQLNLLNTPYPTPTQKKPGYATDDDNDDDDDFRFAAAKSFLEINFRTRQLC
jgi:hypothetical protein